MANDLHNEIAALGVALVEHSLLHGAFEMPQSGSAASRSHGIVTHGLAFQDGHHQGGEANGRALNFKQQGNTIKHT